MSKKLNKEDWIIESGMAFHTAFRKVSDHDNTVKIHRLISELPEDDWLSILEFVYDRIREFTIEDQ